MSANINEKKKYDRSRMIGWGRDEKKVSMFNCYTVWNL